MTKLHFDDLTQITCPFGMLDEDTQKRLMKCDDVDEFSAGGWQYCLGRVYVWFFYKTYRAKPKPKRLVTWLQWDEDDEAICCENRREADHCLKLYGGYIYKIKRDEDGRNPTIELVEVGGKDE